MKWDCIVIRETPAPFTLTLSHPPAAFKESVGGSGVDLVWKQNVEVLDLRRHTQICRSDGAAAFAQVAGVRCEHQHFRN